jgi:hypothetical protein
MKPILNEYRNHWRSCDWWAHWLETARALPEAELRRHASVSANNGHRCVECFCCACLTVREERSKAEFDKRRAMRDSAI